MNSKERKGSSQMGENVEQAYEVPEKSTSVCSFEI